MVELKKSENFESDNQDTSDLFVDNKPKTWINSFFSFIFEIIKTVVISLAIILPIRYFVIQPFYVKGASMEPNFYDKDYLIINEFVYKFKEPQRGDIVVFKNPRNTKEFFIKRIIGLPGERIKVYNNSIYVYNDENPQGIKVDEIYLPEDQATKGNDYEELGDNNYYVLGDNRNRSLDSRFFGAVNDDLIVGKVWLRGWPLDRMSLFSEQEYNF